jgi:hypothetical protein
MRQIDFDTEESAHEFRKVQSRLNKKLQISWPFRNKDGNWSVTIQF